MLCQADERRADYFDVDSDCPVVSLASRQRAANHDEKQQGWASEGHLEICASSKSLLARGEGGEMPRIFK